MKPTLFFDFDDTLVDTQPVMRDFIAEYYGVRLPDDLYLCGNTLWKIVNSYLPPERQIPHDQFYEDWAEKFLISHEVHSKVTTMNRADVHIPRLASKYNLWIVTARQEGGLSVVTRLCQRLFGQHIQGIHFVWRRLSKNEFKLIMSKKDFIASFPGEKVAFFDDNPGEVREVQSILPTFLFDPFGLHLEVPDVKFRVESWDEIAEILL